MVSLLLQQRDERGSGGGGHDDDVVPHDVVLWGPARRQRKGELTADRQTNKYFESGPIVLSP